MVMKRNMMRKNLYQSIRKSFGRYLAIVAIIGLGASMFVGLLMTKSDMIATGQKYMDDQNMFDLRLVSSVGWDLDHVDAISQMEGVVDVEGLIYQDVIVRVGEASDNTVHRFYAIPETINRLQLLGGRMPEAPNECLADGFHASDGILGTTVTLSEENSDDVLQAMNGRTYTVVGYVSTPLYMDLNRGTTTVGSGSLSGYFFLPRSAFDVDYYTEIHVTIPGSYDVYTEEYNLAMESAAERLEPLLKPLVERRKEQVLKEAEEEYEDGLAQYQQGYRDYLDGKLQAVQELADAKKQLDAAEKKLLAGEKQIASGETQLAEGKKTLEQTEKMVQTGRDLLEFSKMTAYRPLDFAETQAQTGYASAAARLQEIDDEIAAVDAEIQQLSDGVEELRQVEGRLAQLNLAIPGLESTISGTQRALDAAKRFPNINAELIAQLEGTLTELNNRYASAVAERDELIPRRDELTTQVQPNLERLGELYRQRQELVLSRYPVAAEVSTLENTLQTIADSRAALDAQFAATEEALEEAEAQLADGKTQLAGAELQLREAKVALETGRQQLEDGKKEYEQGVLDAENQLHEAEAQLVDARIQLADARKTIDGITGDVYVLDRNSNLGYNSLESSSDIVQGVSRVFPAFFLLVAALVCITTMTRMIDEERTQIGTLKALGYSNAAIIGKYLFYAGSGAVIGCGCGVILGSMVFPTTLWEAYKIMLLVTDQIILEFNWWLCGIVVAVYTTVMLLVTWYCCRKALREAPAELIRPKAPDAGKKILLEYLPFWNKISFLNKVTIRNIFRYRQRLAMMLVGIGGCTALLLTGFGLRDSIVNVVDFQFENVTVYDMSVYFGDGQTEEEQAAFQQAVGRDASAIQFYHQTSIEMEFDGHTKEIYLIAAKPEVREFIHLYDGDTQLQTPGRGEVLLSVGVAEAMGIHTGDTILMRNADMQILQLTVSGIYDNHVENYAIISPESILEQWGELPAQQMAFVKVAEDADVYAVSARIADLEDVMNVSVSDDFANMVRGLMDALDLVVWVIVFCAGLLAAIVLYNLTNININERIREIATIKVLGFNSAETAAYVFKENLSLTAIGALFGLILGKFLLMFVMSQIKIDMVWFKDIALPPSYVYSILLTLLSAVIVDFVFYFKLEKINMAEALKSVE